MQLSKNLVDTGITLERVTLTHSHMIMYMNVVYNKNTNEYICQILLTLKHIGILYNDTVFTVYSKDILKLVEDSEIMISDRHYIVDAIKLFWGKS